MITSQEEYSDEDPANPCANYPTDDHHSYAECDDDFVKKSLFPGFKPFWAVDNISQATNTFSMEKEHILDYDDLFTGILPSDCLLPCLRTVARVEKGTTTATTGTTLFSLAFSNEVKVKKTSVDRFSFMDSFNYFGSNLGLWPGLGLYQILELLVGMVLGQVLIRCKS